MFVKTNLSGFVCFPVQRTPVIGHISNIHCLKLLTQLEHAAWQQCLQNDISSVWMLTLLSKYLLWNLSFLLWTDLEFVYLFNLNLIYIDGKKHWKNYLCVWVMAKRPSCSAFNVALSSLCHAPREQKHSTYFTEDDAKSQLLFVNSSDRACTIWPWPNPAVRAAVFCASSGKQTLSLSIF